MKNIAPKTHESIHLAPRFVLPVMTQNNVKYTLRMVEKIQQMWVFVINFSKKNYPVCAMHGHA